MKTAIVFSGGGAKGAYEVGVWKALDELKIKADIATGTSIGSINGALYVQGTLKEAIKLWENIDFNTVFTENISYDDSKPNSKLILKYLESAKNGGLDTDNLRKNLISCIDLDKFYSSSIEYGLTTVKYPKLEIVELIKKDIPQDKLIDYLMASSTVFPVFKLTTIDSENYIDGGFRNSIPIDIAAKLGATRIIVIDISTVGWSHDSSTKAEIITIKPNNIIGSSLVFNKENAKRDLKYGYNDAMKTFKRLYGKQYTFRNIHKYIKEYPFFKSENEYINILEYLGKMFNLDDTKIYNIEKYNQSIIERFNSVPLKEINKLKDIAEISNKKQRLKYIYNLIMTGDEKLLPKLKKIMSKEYQTALYLTKII